MMRTAGIASVADAGKNLLGALNMGWNPRAAFGNGLKGLPLHGASVGGAMTFGGLAMGGAAAGAALGTQMEGDAVAPMAVAGAVAGAAALPLAGLTANLGVQAATGIGKNALKMSKSLGGAAESFATKGPGAIGSVMRGAPVIGSAASAAVGFGSMMVDWDKIKKADRLMDSVRLTGGISGAKAGWAAGNSLIGKAAHAGLGSVVNGKSVIAGSALVAGAAGAFNQMNKVHMGQSDGMVTRPAARTPYLNNAGATGDLVFAMNANRRG